jgi:propanediol dehydratase small subunit
MEPDIVFVPSAFKHEVTEENIRWVLLNHLLDGVIEEDDETKYLSIGFDKSGNLLEVMYNCPDERIVKVFHAMKCRKQFYEALNELGENDGRYDG